MLLTTIEWVVTTFDRDIDNMNEIYIHKVYKIHPRHYPVFSRLCTTCYYYFTTHRTVDLYTDSFPILLCGAVLTTYHSSFLTICRVFVVFVLRIILIFILITRTLLWANVGSQTSLWAALVYALTTEFITLCPYYM